MSFAFSIYLPYTCLCLHLGAGWQEGGLNGDGYKSNTGKASSPHTNHEMFIGLTLDRALQVG